MKPIGYIIYSFWDIKHKGLNDTEWQTITSAPQPEFKKRIYSDLLAAEDAVRQMKRLDFSNTHYEILPIFTPYEEYDRILNAYKKRKEACQ